MPRSLDELEAERAQLLARLARMGDMRRGSITETFRRCGKENCHCAAADDPGHGPFYAFTTKVAGKTNTVQLRPGRQLSKLEREVEQYRSFRALCEELIRINETICQARPLTHGGEAETGGLKKKSRTTSRRRSLAK
jgi:hypothetical protein